MKQMSAGKFKTHCLAVMDQVHDSGEPVVITKHGKPVAKLIPVAIEGNDLLGSMVGKATIMGDVMNTVPLKDCEDL